MSITKKVLGVAALLLSGIGAVALAAPAAVATPSPAGPSFETCANLKNWYVNPDESTRRPTATATGLKFEGNDLVHHGATGSIEGLTAGSYTLAAGSAAPDQDSFFSVEVINGDGTGYATLRWNTSTSKWNMTTGGNFYENASAADLVDMPAVKKSHNLLSFGVGYTSSPPGTVATTISKVTFKGVEYSLTCPPLTPSASASSSKPASASPSVKPSGSGSVSAPPVAVSDSLPVTGAPVPIILGAGAALLALGAGAVVLSRRRRPRFHS
jgi:LPXTG-motif cell wall-anchored protein